MINNAEGYLKAAIQRFKEATWLKVGAGEKGIPAKTYAAGAIYLSGIAAECLYRGFVLLEEPTAEFAPGEIHNLDALAYRQFLKGIKNRKVYERLGKLNAFLYDVWNIDHRYRDHDALTAYYGSKRFRKYIRRIKGDVVKYICVKVIEAVGKLFEAAAKDERFEEVERNARFKG